MPRLIALGGAVIAILMLASDITRAMALRAWSQGRVADGMESMRLAARLNPLSFEVRLDETESLFEGYRQERNPAYLHEAALIGRSLVKDFPGNTLGWAVYSSALIFEATHGGSGMPEPEAIHAVALDPVSVPTIERAMFLLSARREDYEAFKTFMGW